MAPDGSNQERLTHGQENSILMGAVAYPNWSSTNDRILFSSTGDGSTQIYSMKPDGTEQTRLTNNTGFDDCAVWSPDSKKIAFISCVASNKCDIYSMESDGSSVTRLTDTANVFYGNGCAWIP
jgi:TolB protein